ncbi:phage major capsid protein [Micromonospora sp. WMMD1082]|uniref:phage major capsid protein n=1 Tax=Micromonospora sp. WMMD1082 TaxID=3016104 RepID=UPI002417B6AB|nr:phage major capsid protein [Micromonospora sp. WMMD1082]MDG4796205.1 phage major capsid protein [Micromonospora sp. WMMD1082]
MSDTLAEFPALKAAQEKLDAKNKELWSVLDEAGPELDMNKVTSIQGDTKAKVEWIQAKNAEIDEIGVEVQGYRAVAKAAGRKRPGGTEGGAESDRKDASGVGAGAPELKTFGQLFVKSKAFTARQGQNGPEAILDLDLKTLMQTSAGWLPETTRTGRVVDFATRPIQVLDLIPTTTTSQAAVVYMEETTFTNNAAETAEAGTYPESALELTEQSSPVRKIATFIPITDEQLEDVEQARGYVDNRLRFMLRQRMDGQILVGNGTAPNLRGINNVAGIQTQAKGVDPTPDAFYKAMTKIRVTGRAVPDLHVMHPNDWMDIRLLRTSDGVYIWGNPSEAGPERLWGLPVAQSDAQTENAGLTLDSSFTELSMRRGIVVQVSNSHGTYFVEGKQAVRADVRAAFIVYRPTAVCTVTGI